ncbi:MAG TPA: hypothetical protein DD381_13250 [Lentisphaeria bacterium]|nr:MAG: hypothetical protein A2X47_11725 [Lentisphaerae bacterium GWF2_38_69]HBM17288.1 hypothetical protein [Lentisphaeria bacterium]
MFNIIRILSFSSLIVSLVSITACSSTDEIRDAYDLGMGDTVKRQYWIIQSQQKKSDDKNYNIKYYKIQSPTDVDGVKFVPHTITVRTIDV